MIRKKIVKLDEQLLLPVIADAAIASFDNADGKMIPLIIVDARERPDISELVRIHQYLPPGDVIYQWVKIYNRIGKVGLFITFQRPSESKALIEFDVVKQGVVVDMIMFARGVYFQTGQPGDRYKNKMDEPKILIEVGDLGFDDTWNVIWEQALTTHIKKMGNSRNALTLAREHISELRKYREFRIRS